MPKRKSEDSIEFLSKRLKVLEKRLKLRKEPYRNFGGSSSSTSSSSCSSSSSSSSSSPSRCASPLSLAPDDHDDRNAQALEGDVHVAVPAQPVPGTSRAPRAGPSAAGLPHAGPSAAGLLLAGPPTAGLPPAGPSSGGASLSAAPPSSSSAVNGNPPLANGPDGVEAELDQAALLEILGVDPTTAVELGEDISHDVANRFEHIATSGLDRPVRKELLDKYLVPSNCKNTAAPKLNAEIKAALPENVLKRDQAIEFRQRLIAAAISSLGQIISSQLRSAERDGNLLKQLMDAGRILCDIQHGESVSRRNFTLYSLKKDFREQLSNTKIDSFLFGADLLETLKTAKAVSRSVTDIKFDVKNQKQRPTNSRALNWRAGPAARRPPAPGPAASAAPAAPPRRQREHATSSRKSLRHRAKQSRRH